MKCGVRLGPAFMWQPARQYAMYAVGFVWRFGFDWKQHSCGSQQDNRRCRALDVIAITMPRVDWLRPDAARNAKRAVGTKYDS